METQEQKRKNRIKNAILLVLFVGMVVLTCVTWLSGLNLDSVPTDSLFARMYQRFTYGVSGFEIRTGGDAAAEPTRIAVSGANGLVGAQYHAASVSTLYTVLRTPMGEALGSAKGFDPASEADFAAALEGEVLYFGYEGELPLALLSGWMGSSHDSLEKTDLLLLTAKGKLFVHDADGYRCASTHADPAAWREAMRELSAGACSFAAQREDGLADNVRPDTLLFESESATAEQMSVRYPGYLDGQGGSDLTALLEAFAYDPYVRTYDEDKGSTLVFVENFSTLHVSADGSVIFNTSALEGGLEAYIAGEVEQDEVLRLQTDFAYTLLREVQGSMSDSSQAMLFDVEERDDNVCVLSFIQLVGGIPVEAGTPFAWFEFQGNKMIEAQFHLRTLEPTGVRTPVLPGIQAAAAAPSGGLRTSLVYRADGKGMFAAQRCYQK